MEAISYCPKCGAYIPDGADKCLACGFTNESPPITADRDSEDFLTKEIESDLIRIETGRKAVDDFLHSMYRRPDIDLDGILQKQYLTAKIGGETAQYFIGKADMELASTIYHTKEMFGKVATIEQGKKKIHLTLIER